MLTNLAIKNFGLIDNSAIELVKNLNILTGETGAGKSIIIDALRFALGERMESSQVRNTELVCTVEAIFDLSNNELLKHPLFKEYVSEENPEFIINRAYTPDSRSKIKINGFSVTLAQLKELGDYLVDFHGPHDHQMLLSPASHLEIIDKLSNIHDLNHNYSKKYIEFDALTQKLKDIQNNAQSRERELDLLGHQIKELEQVHLSKKKLEEYMQEQSRINNLGTLYDNAGSIIDALENENTGVIENIRKVFNTMNSLNKVDNETEKFSSDLQNILENSEQLLSSLKDYADSLSFQPEEVHNVNTTCDIYNDLLRKFGPTIEDAQKFHAHAKERFDFFSNMEQNDAQLRSKISVLSKGLQELAEKISSARQKTSKNLQKTIEKELSELGINGVRFECRMEKVELNKHGWDSVVFYISPNPGEPLKPLAEIVSSGEAARVMLALKKALINVDPIPVLVFDEIDAQIGGRLGTVTGKKLKEISQKRQVILITHLPQIASFANAHFKVSKSVKNDRTITTVEKLDHQAQVTELAKMMSGEKATDISISHAKTLLKEGQNS